MILQNESHSKKWIPLRGILEKPHWLKYLRSFESRQPRLYTRMLRLRCKAKTFGSRPLAWHHLRGALLVKYHVYGMKKILTDALGTRTQATFDSMIPQAIGVKLYMLSRIRARGLEFEVG